MATKCKKCGGLIPDVTYGGASSNDCKNHIKVKVDVKLPFGGTT